MKKSKILFIEASEDPSGTTETRIDLSIQIVIL